MVVARGLRNEKNLGKALSSELDDAALTYRIQVKDSFVQHFGALAARKDGVIALA